MNLSEPVLNVQIGEDVIKNTPNVEEDTGLRC